MTQERFAKKIGCSKETVRKIEKDKLKLSSSLAEKIFLKTGVSMDWLLANNFNAPPVDGMNGQPYTKEVFERLQAKDGRATSEGRESFEDRHRLIRSVEKLLGSFLAAEKTSMQAAGMVGYRFYCFVEQLEEEFGWDNFSHLKDGQKPWDVVHKAVYGFFEKANFKPVPMADGTMREIVFSQDAALVPDKSAHRGRVSGGRK